MMDLMMEGCESRLSGELCEEGSKELSSIFHLKQLYLKARMIFSPDSGFETISKATRDIPNDGSDFVSIKFKFVFNNALR
jgi:hypothetical protein